MKNELIGRKVEMKEGCIACGICVSTCKGFIEDDTGNVTVTPNLYVDKNNVDEIVAAMENCPCKCIIVAEGQPVFSSISELQNDMKRKYANYKFPKPSANEYDFHKAEYRVSPRYGAGERRYEYTSNRRAESAGMAEFKRCMYSQRRAIVIELLVEYKNRKLMQYVRYEKKQGNFYFDHILEVEKDFAIYAHEIERLKGISIAHKKEISTIESTPKFDFGDYRHAAWDITHIEEVNYSDAILNQIDSDYQYEPYIDTDDMDRYDGRREKTYYCYKISEACQELAKDILWATDYVMQGNSDVQSRVNSVIEDSTKNIVAEVKKKYNMLINYFM